MNIRTATLNLGQGKEASGPYQVLLNSEPFDVERAAIDVSETTKTVVFTSPIVELYQRAIGFQLPRKALPGTYPIGSDAPSTQGFLLQNRYFANPGPDDPAGWGDFQFAYEGFMELIEWDPATHYINGRFELKLFISEQDQFHLIKAKFDLRPA